jgi:hypothetical protein
VLTVTVSKADRDAALAAQLDTFCDDELSEEDHIVDDADAPQTNADVSHVDAKTKEVKAKANPKPKDKDQAPMPPPVQENGMLSSVLCYWNKIELIIAGSKKDLDVGNADAQVHAAPKVVKGMTEGKASTQPDAVPKHAKARTKGKAPTHPKVQEKGMFNPGKYGSIAQSTSFPQSLPFSNSHTGKRKRDNAPEPTHDSQQTTKKLKTRHVEEQLIEQSSAEHMDTDTKARDTPRKLRAKKPLEMPQETRGIPAISVEKTDKEVEQTQQENQQQYMSDIGMHTDDQDASTKVVRFPEQGVVRVLTASTDPATGKPILHDTPIFRRQQPNGHRPQSALPDEQPFLKPGTHGRHGDFQDDPDRRTGRGHQLDPEDQTALGEYMECRGQVLQRYPQFPSVDEEDEVYSAIKQD